MIHIEFDPISIKKYIKSSQQAVDLSFRFAMNRAILQSRYIATQRLEKKFGIKESGSTKLSDYVEAKKVKLREVRQLDNEVSLRAAHREKRGLLNHVLGPRRPQHLEGLSPSNRRKIFIRLAKMGAHPHAFVAMPRTGKQKYLDERGKPQLFARGDYQGKKDKLFRPTIPDASQTMSRENIQAQFERMATETMTENFYRKLNMELERLNREPLTMREQRGRGG